MISLLLLLFPCLKLFEGLPMENVQIKASLLKLFGEKYARRKQEVMDDSDNKKVIAE